MRKNLVVVRAGLESLHPSWFERSDRQNFDLLVVHYRTGVPQLPLPGVSYLCMPGIKIVGWMNLVAGYGQRLAEYEQLAFIDEDIATDGAALSRLFDVGSENNLAIWQPSLSWDSYFSFAGTLKNPAYRLRYVSCVEMMCVFFSKDAFSDTYRLTRYGWETGIDLVWPSAVHPSRRRFAIIDDVAVKHTKAVANGKDQTGFAGRKYEDDIHACLNHFGMTWPKLIATSAVEHTGRSVGRLGILRSLSALRRILELSPQSNARELVSRHIRNQILSRQAFKETVRSQLASEQPPFF